MASVAGYSGLCVYNEANGNIYVLPRYNVLESILSVLVSIVIDDTHTGYKTLRMAIRGIVRQVYISVRQIVRLLSDYPIMRPMWRIIADYI